MYKIIRTLMALAGFFIMHTVHAQEGWTLQQCIDYAISHNIDLQKQAELINQKRIQLNTAQNARLPHVSAQVKDDFLFHNSMTNGMSDLPGGLPNSVNLMNVAASINASMPLLDAGRMKSQKKAAEFSLESALANMDQAKKDVGIQVAVQYLNALYHQGMAEVSSRQVEISKDFLNKARIQVEQGSKPESELAQAEAQLAADEYQLSIDSGNAKLATIMLAQLLTLEDVYSFKVSDASLNVDIDQHEFSLNASALFNQIAETYPSIRAATAQIHTAEADLAAKKSDKRPSLDLVGSIGTNSNLFFNNAYNDVMPGFFRQFRLNHNEVIGLRLNIPIFTGFQTRNAIRMAESQVVLTRLGLSEERLRLRTEIEQACFNANVALSHYNAAVKSEHSARTNYDYQQRSYEAGRTTIFDLHLVNQQWIKAQQDVLQSRYDYLIRLKILDFYTSVIQ